MIKHIVYQTVNTVNNKIYIGVHKIETLEFDGYIGCGVNIHNNSTYAHPKTPFQYAVKKYGIKAFIRTTLKVFDTRQDALDLERWLVDEAFVRRPDTYNVILGGGNKDLIPTNSHKTYLYDKEGNFVKEFNTATAAAKFIGVKSLGNISRAAKTGMFVGGYQVSYIKLPYMKNYTMYKKTNYTKMCNVLLKKYSDNKVCNIANPVKIAQYDLNDNLVKIWDTMSACRKAGFTNVQAVVEGRRYTCKGYKFKKYYEN